MTIARGRSRSETRWGAARWGLLALAFAVALLPACSSRKKDEAPEGGPGVAEGGGDQSRTAIEAVEDRQKLESEYEDFMFEKRFEQARRFQKGMQLQDALQAVDDALTYKPYAEDALSLRAEIQRQLGQRAGDVRTVVNEHYEGYKAKLEEQKVTVRRWLDKGDQAMNAQDWDAARRAYENAAFIVTTAKYAPLGGDDDLAELGARADSGLAEVRRTQAESDAVREKEDTAEALRQVADEQEKALVESRDRRARLLSAAIDQFNLERFDAAIEYADQVLAEEPDNTLAREIIENSRKARAQYMHEKFLRDLKDSYRQWQVDIEETKVPSSKILSWPSQSYWDKISKLRAVRRAASGGRQLTTEEQNVLNTLNTRTIDLPFEAYPFPQAVKYLNAASGVNFYIDARAKEDLEAVEVTLQVNDITVNDALQLLMMQVSPEGEVVWEITGNVVRFIRKEHQKKNFELRIHPVADLTLGLTDFIPPQITQVGVNEDSEVPLFGGQAEEAPQPYGTIEELAELVRTSVMPQAWEEGTVEPQGKNLVVYNTAQVQEQVSGFLDDLRAFSGIVVTIQSRFLTVTDGFLRDVGVDFRGLGGTNGGPLAVLDDVTSGLDDNASAGIDNSGPGVNAGGAALAPSSGLFFNDGADGDFRGRSENIFSSPLGQMLSALGGGTFQVTFIDDLALSAIVRATEKSVRVRELTAPSLTVYNTQRANLTVVNQISFVQDFDVEVAQTAFIADPVIGVIQDGLTLDVRPTVSNDRQYITLELRPTIADLVTPIATFQTLLGASIAVVSAQNPVTIQLPEIDLRVAESTVRIPDRGSILLGGLKDINIQDKKSTTPILGNIPIIRFLFTREGKSEEIEHLMIVVTATITDLGEQTARMRG